MPSGARHLAYASGLSRPLTWDTKAYIDVLPVTARAAAWATLPVSRRRYLELLGRPDDIWTPSSWSAEKLAAFAERPVDVVAPVPPSVTRVRSGSRSGFVVVSRLVRHKRVDIAVKAFNGALDTLTVIGTGPDLTRLQALASENVLFTGFIDDASRDACLAKSKALISTSTEEFGMAMVEALAIGIPVITERLGAAIDLLSPGSGVLLDPPLTPRDLAAAIEVFDVLNYPPTACREAASAVAPAGRTIIEALRQYLSH